MSASTFSKTGQRILVMTGGTSGFGRRVVERIVAERLDWRVLLLARPSPHARSLAAAAAGSDRLQMIDVELASLASVEAAIDEVRAHLGGAPIDALGLNAGVQAVAGDQASIDGLEITFAVNHVAHFLVADRLARAVKPGGRIVLTSSVVHDPDAFCLVGLTRADWQPVRQQADPVRAQDHLPNRVDRGEARYCGSKLLNLMTARHLAAEHPAIGVLAFNPGLVPGTDIARERNILQVLGWKYIMSALAPVLPATRTVERSASDLLWLLTEADPLSMTGSYVDGRTVAPGSASSRDAAKIAEMAGETRAIIAEVRARRGGASAVAAPPSGAGISA